MDDLARVSDFVSKVSYRHIRPFDDSLTPARELLLMRFHARALLLTGKIEG